MGQAKHTPGRKTRADCTVRALAVAADIAYELAEAIAADGGRKAGRRAASAKIIDAAKRHGVAFRKLRFSNKTLGKFLREHPAGNFYLRKRGHAYAVVDGVVSDATPLGSIVIAAWEARAAIAKAEGK